MNCKEACELVVRLWGDNSYSTREIAEVAGRSFGFVRAVAERLDLPRPRQFNPRRRDLRLGVAVFAETPKQRAIRLAEQKAMREAEAEAALAAHVAAVYARIGPYQDDPRAVRERGGPVMRASMFGTRSMVGCAAAMTAEAR